MQILDEVKTRKKRLVKHRPQSQKAHSSVDKRFSFGKTRKSYQNNDLNKLPSDIPEPTKLLVKKYSKMRFNSVTPKTFTIGGENNVFERMTFDT
jgi:hypothetical protein